jgi:LysR family positive regulator for ilvC
VIDPTPIIFAGPNVDGLRDVIRKRQVDWAAVPLVLPAAGLARELVDEWFRRRRVAPNVYAEIQGHEATLALVALGCGVGVVPRLVLDNSGLRDRIAPIPVRPALPKFQIALCVRERSFSSPLVAAVWGA